LKPPIYLHSPLECLQPHISRYQSKIPSRYTNFAIFTDVLQILLPPKTERKIRAEDGINNLHRPSIGRTRNRGIRNSLLLIRIRRHWILSILPPPETHGINHQRSSHIQSQSNNADKLGSQQNPYEAQQNQQASQFDYSTKNIKNTYDR